MWYGRKHARPKKWSGAHRTCRTAGDGLPTVLQLFVPNSYIYEVWGDILYFYQHFTTATVITKYSRTSMARKSLGPWKFVLGMGSSSQRRLIKAPG